MLGAITLLLIPLVIITSKLTAVGQQIPSWFNTGQSFTVAPVSDEPFGKFDTYNAPCANQKFAYYHFGQSNSISEGERTECVHTEAYGEISTLGGLHLKNGLRAYKLYTNETSYNSRIYPIVNSRDVFTLSGGAGLNRENLYIYKNLPRRMAMHTYPGINKQVFYRLTEPIISENTKVTFQNGEPSAIDPTTLSYAASGSLMLANSVEYQTIIDTTTLKARKFGFKTPTYSGAYPKVNTALSENGSLALISTTDGLDSRLYNLRQCSGMADGSVVEDCQMVDMFTAIKAKLPNLKNITRAQFTADDTLYFKAKTATTQGVKESWYKAALPQVGPQTEYLALGDSFASGEGAYSYKLGTDQAGNKCHVSLSSYGHLIKEQLGLVSADVIACSGAKQKDIFSFGKDYSNNYPQAIGKIGSQYDQEVFGQFLPGYRQQLDFVKRYKPQAVTLSIGGNDIGFGGKLQECVLGPTNCYSNQTQKTSILAEFKAQFPELVKTYSALKVASPETKIYVLGYPNFAKPGGDCAINVRLSNEEIKLSEAMIADLNYIIEAASKNAGIFYVDTANVLYGHRLCEATKDSLGFNGITFGNDTGLFGFKFIGSESYHPNKLGHQLYANNILISTKNLTAAMPAADEAIDLSSMPSRLANSSNTTSVPLPIPFMEDSSYLVKRGTKVLIDALVNSWLTPNSTFRVEVHSEPQQIGEATAKNQETLGITAQIPPNIELGIHTLHVLGVNGMGEQVDFYKTITVIDTDSDVDGDGIENQKDNCPFIEPIAIDAEDDLVPCSVRQIRQNDPEQTQNTVSNSALNTQPIGSSEEIGSSVKGLPLINSSASSSENNSLTSPLDAPPPGSETVYTTTHSPSHHLRSLADAIQDISSNNYTLSLQDWKKYVVIFGATSSMGAALYLRSRK